jgi:RNA polymerase I-specific transcription initiation factor RRN3
MESYNQLLAQFKPYLSSDYSRTGESGEEQRSPRQLQSWLEALSYVVSQLDSQHASLVDIILSLPWTKLDDGFVATYVKFVGGLVSSRPEWAKSVLERIVKGFKYRELVPFMYIHILARRLTFPFFPESPYAGTSPEIGDPGVTVRKSAERQHLLLHTLLELIPTLPSTLMPILSRGFPAKRAPRADHVVYMTNALKVVEYCPAVAAEVWRQVVDRAIKMDLDIQTEIDELEDEEGGLDEAIFGFDASEAFDKQLKDGDENSDSEGEDDAPLDLDNLSDEDEPDLDDEGEATVTGAGSTGLNPEAIARIKEMAAKLDAVLKVIFDHLERTRSPRSASSSSFISSESELLPRHYDDAALSQTLLSLFDAQLLPTFSTHHVQFLLFYHSSVSPMFTDAFIGLLLNHALFDAMTPVVTKVAAVSYVASFVSRAKHVGKEEVRRVMGLLSGWCEDWLDGVVGGPTRNAAVFYAVVQASLYLFCFRWKDFLEEEEEEYDAEAGISIDLGLGGGAGARRWTRELDGIRRTVGSSMNPLKVRLGSAFLFCMCVLTRGVFFLLRSAQR